MSILRSKVSPPVLGREWGISPDKIVAWIKSGDLKAMDASTNRGTGRPRYLIDRKDIEAFEAARAVVPPAPRARRRRKLQNVKEFF